MANDQTKPGFLQGRRTRRKLAMSSTSMNQGVVHNKSGGHCKIRKRVSQSSSSSSIVKNYRFKRAIFVGKSAGSTTPVPNWKLVMADSQSPLHTSVKNGVPYVEVADSTYSNNNLQNTNTNMVKEGMSARKLGATLWEIDGLNSPVGLKEEDFEVERLRAKKSSRRVAKFVRRDPHTPVYDQIDGSKAGGHRRRSSATSHKLEITEYVGGSGVQDIVGNTNCIEVLSPMAETGETNLGIKTRLKDVNNSLVASKELVKVLFRMLSQEEQNSSSITLISALRAELDRARVQVDMVIQEQSSNSNQIDALLKHFAEEKAAWKSKERERVRETVSSLAREIEIERKLRRQCERLNKKLGKELADTRAHFSRAMKKLEREKRAREILEQTCDELARGIGEERVEVEELKRESEKAREEVEKERQMLQLADVLREERVQMKLAEAKYEYEEKNAALETLKSKIETYLKTHVGDELEDDTSSNQTTPTQHIPIRVETREGKVYETLPLSLDSREIVSKRPSTLKRRISTTHYDTSNTEKKASGLQEFLNQIQANHLISDQTLGGIDGEKDPKRDSGDSSELHSIELNMENNTSYKWNFPWDGKNQAQGDTQGEPRRASIDEVFKGRRSLSEKIQWENICLQRKTSNGSIEWDFTTCNGKQAKNINRLSYQVSHDYDEDDNENDGDFKRYKPVNKPQSPTISAGNSSRLREACSAILRDLASRREIEANVWVNET